MILFGHDLCKSPKSVALEIFIFDLLKHGNRVGIVCIEYYDSQKDADTQKLPVHGIDLLNIDQRQLERVHRPFIVISYLSALGVRWYKDQFGGPVGQDG